MGIYTLRGYAAILKGSIDIQFQAVVTTKVPNNRLAVAPGLLLEKISVGGEFRGTDRTQFLRYHDSPANLWHNRTRINELIRHKPMNWAVK